MAAAKDTDGDALPEVPTDPPPPGEDDAYGAPTRVGPMSPTAIAKMMRDAEVPAPSGLRGSVPRPTPVPAAPEAVSKVSSDTLDKSDESKSQPLDAARDLQNQRVPAAPPLAAATPATPNAPVRLVPAFPEWLPSTTPNTAEESPPRRRFLPRIAAAAVLVVLASSIVWWLFARR